MRSKPDFQHTFFALSLILLAGLAADVVLWPRDELPPVTQLSPEDYFSAAFIDRAQAFRGPQAWLGVASLLMLVLVPLLIALRWPSRLEAFGDLPGRSRALACAVIGAAITGIALTAALPFELVAFLRSRDYGLSVQSVGGWLWDWLLAGILFALGVALLAAIGGALIRRLGRGWWLPFGVVLIGFAVLLGVIAPVVIDPLFGDFKKLPPGQVQNDVRELARKSGVRAGGIYVVDAAKRTNAANAYVTGLGSTKRVVIYDTLIRDFDRGERRAVIAHELGHAKRGDVTAGLLWFSFVALVSLFAIDILARVMARRRGLTLDAPAAIAMVLASAMVAVALTQPAASAYSRRVEARADAFALQVTQNPDAAISLERRLTINNIARPEPPALLHGIFGTHPTPMQRIGMAVTVKREQLRPR